MTHNHPAPRVAYLLLFALLGVSASPVTGVAGEDSQAEWESRRLENEARRVEEQGRRNMEDRARTQAEALRSQEDSIRRTEATQARIEANSQQLVQQQNEQLRNYSYPYYPVNAVPPPVSALAPATRSTPNRDLTDAVSGMTFGPLSERLKTYFGAQSGVLVVSAGGRSPFGLQDGDVIIAVDGRVPTDMAHATRILRSYQAGERVKLRIQRDRRTMDLDVTAPD